MVLGLQGKVALVLGASSIPVGPLRRTPGVRRRRDLSRQRQGIIHQWVDDPRGRRLNCKHLTNVRREPMR
jgi:hypothetical protein